MWIKGFETIFGLTQFTVKKNINEHSVCTFCASVDAADERRFLSSAGRSIEVVWDEGEKNACVFCGRVAEVHLRKTLHSAVLEVRAESLSAAEDEDIHTRIWQDPHKKLGTVLSAAQLALITSNLKLSKVLMAQTYAQPILQNQETNFAFLQRMADYMGVSLWVDDTKKGRGTIALAETLSDAVHMVSASDVLRYEAVQKTRGRKEITLTLRKYLPFGARVKLPQEKGEYVICGLQVCLEHAVYTFCYRLAPYVPWKYELPKSFHLEKTLCLKGKVENIKDPENRGRIQVSFMQKEVQDMDRKRLWISYQTPYTGIAGGIVFLPDVGDKVNVVFSNEGISVISASRENVLAEECQKVEEKYIGNNTKRRIFFQDKALKIASGEHTIQMNDDKIELTAGDSRITMEKDRICLRQGKTELFLNAKGVYIKAGDSEMALNEQGILGKTGKEIGWDAQGAVNIAGRGNVNVQAKGSPLSLGGSVVNIG